jgi:hypothetical protein
MKKIIYLIGCLSLPGCQNLEKQETNIPIAYPILIDDGKKRIEERQRRSENTGEWEVYLDTIAFSKGELYRRDSSRHPLTPFYLSYPEWETINCIVAIDERDYWDKAMIALIEKAGTLRISYRGQLIHLKPVTATEMKEGNWSGTFSNDTIKVTIVSRLEKKRILKSLTGFGSVEITNNYQSFYEESVFLVSKIE